MPAIRTLIAAIGLLTFFAFPALAEGNPVTQIYKPSVQVSMPGPMGGMCSGTVIWSDRDRLSGKVGTYVLFAKHCTSARGQIVNVEKTDYSDTLDAQVTRSYPATVWGISSDSDLAIAKLDDSQHIWPDQPAQVAGEDFRVAYGMAVQVTAYPLGLTMTTTDGRLGYVEKYAGTGLSTSGRFQRATPDVAPGSSGGALYAQNAEGDYVLIGITTAGYRGFTFMNLFTPVDEVRAYVNVAKRSFEGQTK